MTNSLEDEDGVTVYLDPAHDCGLCGFEISRWSHAHPDIYICLNCDRTGGGR